MLLTKIPWTQIIKYSPLILKASKDIYENVRDYISKKGKRPGDVSSAPDIAELEKRITALERNELAQAELAEKMAEQIQNLTEAVRVLSIRLNYAFWFSFIAIIISIVVIFLKS
jgi:hypothetical protein